MQGMTKAVVWLKKLMTTTLLTNYLSNPYQIGIHIPYQTLASSKTLTMMTTLTNCFSNRQRKLALEVKISNFLIAKRIYILARNPTAKSSNKDFRDDNNTDWEEP